MINFRAITEDNYDPENHVAEHVYKKLGFMPTGVFEHGEYELRLDL